MIDAFGKWLDKGPGIEDFPATLPAKEPAAKEGPVEQSPVASSAMQMLSRPPTRRTEPGIAPRPAPRRLGRAPPPHPADGFLKSDPRPDPNGQQGRN